jgi:SAM-dependent methyltransferase
MDELHDVDWAAHWRALVEARAASALVGGVPTGGQDPTYWSRRAARYQRNLSERPDPFLDVLLPWVRPSSTVLDVGAGFGRHAVPLLGRAEWVTVVEPSEGMRARIPDLPNLTVIASDWLDAAVQPSSVVICAHVLYGVLEPVPFIEKLEQSATERVFLAMRGSRNPHPTERLLPRPRQPELGDCFNLLRQLGIAPEVTWWRVPVHRRWGTLEEAVDECREWLGARWDDESGRAWLAANLRPTDDGLLFTDRDTMTGALHWRPGERG